MSNSNPGWIRRFRIVARSLPAGAAALLFSCCAFKATQQDAPQRHFPLHLRAPDLAAPLVEAIPPAGIRPDDPIKAAVFDRINSDRAAAGLPPVAWDDAAARVAD
ncbi:MAG TPA: hypothetical protein VFZ57_05725, partial [Thermoanaerobaculia bacterium]|nr:hypothetical protein [Thermoanaerobaculia bacterium]